MAKLRMLDGPTEEFPYTIIALDPKPQSIAEQLRAIPRAGIKMVIGRLHVGTPDAEIAADWERRCDEAKLGDQSVTVTPYQRRRIIRYALAAHHANQQLCRDFRL